ncbi:MAG: cation diffusion facilitator family transporter [Lachnospiraceae bacterium]|nr:cation diffusion facilitator family transporter [Lachnospiraceae bacterium]
MTGLIIRLFIKDHDQVKNPKVRERYGVVAGLVGILCNLFLTTFKIITGLVTGTMSIVADSINNLSDAASSIVTLIGFKLSGKPADKEHPYGHGRIEYIAGFVVAALVIAIAFELFVTSIKHIFEPVEMDVSITTIIILIVAICVKLWMFLFYSSFSKKIGSKAMKATALDSRNDCLTTGVALISVIIKIAFDVNIDAYACLIVSIFVLFAGIGSAMETMEPLLGEAPNEDLVSDIKEIVLSRDCVLGTHDLRVHEYGPTHTIASLHVELPYTMTLVEAHEVIDEIERELQQKEIVKEVTIHVDPVVTDDEEMLELKEITIKILKKAIPAADLHDFRMTRCDNINKLIFDIVVPYDYKRTDESIKRELSDRLLKIRGDLELVITVDRG